MSKKLEYIRAILPHIKAAVGSQHGFLVRWAIAKSIQETGANLGNSLIRDAQNALGIKGGSWDEDAKKWNLFPGVPVIWKEDSRADGRYDGKVPWRVFRSLEECFGEFVKMLNSREPYQPARNKIVALFEDIYADRTPGHTMGVIENIHEATALMEGDGLCDAKGRML